MREKVDVGYHLDYCGHRVIEDVRQMNTHPLTKNLAFLDFETDTLYVLPEDAIDWIIPHQKRCTMVMEDEYEGSD